MSEWTNEAAILRWGAMPRAVLEKMDPDGDFAKRHLISPVLLRLLGDVRGRRVLDAGCGQGYFSRMLADRGALVVGVEPGQSLFEYAQEKEVERRQGIRYVQADLSRLPDLGPLFDLCVASMVLPVIPDWAAAMRSCVAALAPGGTFVSRSTIRASRGCGPRGGSTGSTRSPSTSRRTRSPARTDRTSTGPSLRISTS